jgi:Ni2+-binding GTPase involved in maturation of urease and hydrogenase
MDALRRQARALNPDLDILIVSARTGDGMDEFTTWMRARHGAALA